MIFFFIMPSGLYFEYFIIKSSEEQNPFPPQILIFPVPFVKEAFPPLGDLLHYLYLLRLISEPPAVISYPFLPENLFHYANSILHGNIRYRFPSSIIFQVFSACLFFQMTWSFMARLSVVILTCPPALGRARQGLRVLSCGVVVCAHVQGENLSCPFSSTVQLERTERHCLFAMELSKPSRLTGQCTLGILLFVSISPVP